jgi:hypothetical protein
MRPKCDVDREELQRLWFDDSLNTCEIADRLGVSMNTIYRERTILGLPKRYSGKRQDCELDPTPEQIEERALEVRSRWTPEEERRRGAGGASSPRWRPQSFSMDSRGFAIQH